MIQQLARVLCCKTSFPDMSLGSGDIEMDIASTKY